jgi:hypothetical protein
MRIKLARISRRQADGGAEWRVAHFVRCGERVAEQLPGRDGGR